MNQEPVSLAELVEKWDAGKFELDWHEAYIAKNKAASIKPLRYDAHRDWMKAIYQAGAEAALLAQHAVAEPQRSTLVEKMRQFADECLRRISLNPQVDGNELHTKDTYRDILRLCELAVHAAEQPKLTANQLRAIYKELKSYESEDYWDQFAKRANGLLTSPVAPPLEKEKQNESA